MSERTLTAVLVDDEPLSIRRLQRGLDEIGGVRVVGAAQDAVAGAEAIASLRPDVVFLDIRMPSVSGLDLARALSGEDAPQIVFVSAFDSYAAAAFEVAAVDYLLKPAPLERLRAAVERVRRRLADRDAAQGAEELAQVLAALRAESGGERPPPRGELWITHSLGRARLPATDIVRAVAERDYVRIHTRERSYLVRGPLQDLAAKLDPLQFARAHRSVLVRLDCVSEVVRRGASDLSLTLADGSRVPVGRTHAAKLLALLGAELPTGSSA
jgi:DNA-binding LytR/AlgR family response regulator